MVSSASIACGAHAGSRTVIERTVVSASKRRVVIGAHPGYPDREGFGRRESALSLASIEHSLREQIELIASCCRDRGVSLGYVKLHGALYNRAAADKELAGVIAMCIARIDSSLTVLSLPRSELAHAASTVGLNVAREAFIDRAYMSDGSLVPRDRDGALIHDVAIAAERATEIASNGSVLSVDGTPLHLRADSLCVHGDGLNALKMVRTVSARLQQSGIAIRPFVR